MATRIIEDIWIITQMGIPLFTQSSKDEEGDMIMGGMITAIQKFAKNLASDNLKCITLSNERIAFCHCDQFFMVARSNDSVKEKVLFDYLNSIRDQIHTRYGNEMKNWNGDMDIFKDIKDFINIREDPKNLLGVSLNKEQSRAILKKL